MSGRDGRPGMAKAGAAGLRMPVRGAGTAAGRPVRERYFRALLAACLLGLFPAAVPANAPADERRDHERARQAVDAGEVLPLRAVLDLVERSHPGQVIDVELERERGQGGDREYWVYKLKILRAGGALLKLRVNARNGEILGDRERAGGADAVRGGGGADAHSGR